MARAPIIGLPPARTRATKITPHLKPLEGLKNDFILLENLWNKNTVGRNGHWPKVPAWLSGGYVERTTGDDLDAGGVTVDQFAAQRIGDRTPLPSFELGLEPPRSGIDVAGGGFARLYGSFLSRRDPHTPAPKEIVPQLAFDRLYRNRRAPVSTYEDLSHPSVLASLERDDVSVLDLVMEDAQRGEAAIECFGPGAVGRIFRIRAIGGATCRGFHAAAETVDQ